MSWHEADPAMPAREKALLRKNWIRWAFLVGACLFYTWFYTGFLPYTMLYAVLLLSYVGVVKYMAEHPTQVAPEPSLTIDTTLATQHTGA